MPSLGADMDAGTLLEWLVHPGDVVHRGQSMAVVDTDKAAVELESFDDGVVDALLVEPGTRVAVGTPLATIRGGAPPGPGRRAAAAATEEQTPDGSITRSGVDRAAAGREAGVVRASPYARRLAGERGIDLTQVSGTGPGGAVRSDDVLVAGRKGAPEGRPGPAPAEQEVPARPGTTATAGSRATIAASRATIATLMSRAKREIPHYYVATTVDMHAAVEWLRRLNRDRDVSERIVPAAVLLKAAAMATARFPELNGFWTDDHFVPAGGVHLGVAVVVRHGALVAPCIHDTDALDVPAVMRALRDLVTRARSGRLTRAELADPTLTVTDLGDQGVEEVIGVIYPPQVALLGIGTMADRPWAVDGLLGVRPLVRLTLSGDHRATDGYTGARFLAAIDELLQQPEAL